MADCKREAISEEYADFIVEKTAPFNSPFFDLGEICFASLGDYFNCIYAPLDDIQPISINRYPYSTIPTLFTIEDTTALEVSGILRLQNQPVIDLKGQGTIIGIIDTGIDYEHEAFLDASGNTRIEAIWDMTINDGNVPGGFFYGSEYTREMINTALRSDNPREIVPTTDEIGHGTFIAGVAAGSENVSAGFIGAVPLATLLVVKLKPAKRYLRDYYFIREDAPAYQENDIILAIEYIVNRAKELKKPVSIVMGLGSNRGDHSGFGNMSYVLNRICERSGVSVSVSLGNEGNKRGHFSGNISSTSSPELMELRVDERQSGVLVEIWGMNPQIFSVSITSPTGEILNKVPPRLNASENYTFLFEQTILQLEYKLVESNSGEELILLRFLNPTAGIWRIFVYGESEIKGSFNAWLPMSNFLYENTYFLKPDPLITLTVPSAATNPISVATYNAINGALSIESSKGFTRKGEFKPDVTAPGVNVLGPSINGSYTVKSGSSIAAAITAGAAAQFLSWALVRGNDYSIKNADIKSYMIRGAKRVATETYPNPDFGYGTLDMYNAFEVMRGN